MGFGRFRPAIEMAHLGREWYGLAKDSQPTKKRNASKAPILSVVIPCHNAARWIPNLVHSIQSQNVDDIEIIVVNDKSTDASVQVLKSLAFFDKRIRLLQGVGEGPGKARNLGVSYAAGKYLTFADADDLILPGAYRAMLAAFERGDAAGRRLDFVTGGYIRKRGSSTTRPQIVERVHLSNREFVTAASCPEVFDEPVLWNKVFRTSFWRESIGMIPEQGNYEDQLPVLLAMIHAESFTVLSRDVYVWRLSAEGTSRSGTKATETDALDRKSVIETLWAASESTAPPELREFMLVRFIRMDLRLYSNYLPHFRWGELYRETFRQIARNIMAWVEDYPNVWEQVPAESRILVWALANGSDADIDEAVGKPLELDHRVSFDVETRALSPDAMAEIEGIPDELLTVRNADLKVTSTVQSVHWRTPESLEIEVQMFVNGLNLGNSRPIFSLVESAPNENIDKPVVIAELHAEAITNPENNFDAQNPFEDYTLGSWKLELELDRVSEAYLMVELNVWGYSIVEYINAGKDVYSQQAAPLTGKGRICLDSVRGVGGAKLRFIQVPHTGEELVSWSAQSAKCEVCYSDGSSETVRAPKLSYQRLLGWSGSKELSRNKQPIMLASNIRSNDGLESSNPSESIIRANAKGFAVIDRRSPRVVVNSVYLDGPKLILEGASSSQAKLVIWLSSANNVVRAETQWNGHSFRATFDVNLVRGKSYFLRWSRHHKNRFTRASVLPGELHKRTVLAGDYKSLVIEPRQNGTVAVFVHPALPVIQESKWGYQIERAGTQDILPGVYFESFSGKNTSDNPGAILQYLIDKDVDYPLWVGIRDFEVDYPKGAIPVVVGSSRWLEIVTRAAVLVTNDNLPSWYRKRDDQLWLQTWHGTPIKRLLFDAHPHFVGLVYRRLMKRQAADWDLLLGQNAQGAELIAGSCGYKGQTLVGEYPRNIRLEEALLQQDEIRRRLGIPRDKKVLLWAPTWRYSKTKIPFPAATLARENNAVVLIRSHHMASLRYSGRNVIDVSQYPVVEDLMAISDVLISDYSSIFYDFKLTARPSVVYVPDLEQYRDKERGFYGEWPWDSGRPVATTEENLRQRLKELLRSSESNNERIGSTAEKNQALGNSASDTLQKIQIWIEKILAA